MSKSIKMFKTLSDPENVEFVFIVGYLGEKIKEYMDEYHPKYKVNYVLQDEMLGQSHAIYLAKEFLNGPMLMVFADTLIELQHAEGFFYEIIGRADHDHQGFVRKKHHLIEKDQALARVDQV